MFDFAALPPEVNSARMYSGAGAGPLQDAAAAWHGIASELESTATSTMATVAALQAHWEGPSADAMSGKMAQQVEWLTNLGQAARRTAEQANAAVTAYQAAFSATVNPALVAENRAELPVLVATNILGQNSSAIADLEAEYSEMWGQDAAAMTGYQASSAAATEDLGDWGLSPQELVSDVVTSVIDYAPSAPLSLLAMFNVLWALDTPGNALGDAVHHNHNNIDIDVSPAAVPDVPKVKPGTARLGIGESVGRLRVPPAWAAARTSSGMSAPAFRPIGGEPGSPLGVMPLGGGVPRDQEERRRQPKYGHRPTVMPQFVGA